MPALIMFINGLSLMVLEMVGARLMAPWMGTSTVVWTSLIGVIMASLSLGYWLGGRLADRHVPDPEDRGKKKKSDVARTMPRAWRLLGRLLLAASLLTLLAAMAQNLLLEFLSRHVSPLHLAALIGSLALFALPSMLSGMVSPYVMRLAISDANGAGSVIGRLNAVGTVGSIAGTFLGGFVLVSWFGSVQITLGVSACFLLASLLATKGSRLPGGIVTALLALCAVYTVWNHAYQQRVGFFSYETPYNSIRIFSAPLNGRPAALLMTDPGSAQSAMYLDDPDELVFDYTRFYALGTELVPRARRILMLGGGAYSVPKWLLSGRSGLPAPYLKVDVVELDPGMTMAARRHFGLAAEDPRLSLFHEDARAFLNRHAESEAGSYDLIFEDVFNSEYTVPFHVGTVEAARRIRTLLKPDGLFLMNIISAIEGDDGRLLRAIYHAFAESFPDIALFTVQGAPASQVQNIMLAAAPQPGILPGPEERGSSPALAPLLAERWQHPVPRDVPALTDNFAPVERYSLGFTD